MSVVSDILDARRQDAIAKREQDREDRQQKWDRRRERRERRNAAIKATMSWLGAHPVDVLMSVVVVVPGILAWTAMATFGHEIYGAPGWAFPAFSEAASWAFAFAAQRARRSSPPRPVWLLLVGLWIFTAVQAALNYLHGAQTAPYIGVLMAIVSVSGVVVHQIHMWSDRPRRTGAERRAARRARLAERLTHRMAMAATRQAAGQVYADGTVELLVREGTVALRRHRARPWRHRVVPLSVADEVEQWLATVENLGDTVGNTPVPDGGNTPGADQAHTPAPETVPDEGGTVSDLRRDRGRDTHEDTSIPEGGNTSTRGWVWEDLVGEFRRRVAAGEVNPTSQRNIRLNLKCSRERAKALVQLYQDEIDGDDGLAGVAA